MKRHSKHTVYNPYTDINIVPLVDLTFNLLIIFMLATPLLESAINIKIPHAESGDPIEDTNSRVISVQKDGKLYLDDVPVTLDGLRVQIEKAVAKNPEVPVMVRADQQTVYREFIEVVDLLKTANVKKMGIVTTKD